ncbi:carbohydrate ABC transporter membrane protein 2 (CUT1 family) [Salisediminibacterium halotolerans]|uniref:Arabinogalactan oligomer / maltooligosaccharide transport system permease protein n=2 Tax=Salisediminibacterium halotolerans TaxID=517425 RepID=A0A1H9VGY4_9BACI|nr:carbohydrate ABC transporter membrane protein 2 (CUT1 family) [Actinophytocola xinjiangensis]RPE87434.1 carbohydrate ABC transporter membrane protein 2 (CUT1 family) [Salisediminibacterium halotolerans]TWG35309.1 carbohydrate ABC transporter membrane protein 2 (CUT1 family) [Salisediminibacterium halotolerans]GEL07941.1 maltose ABC transporter permease [Salisediminibacterium halotolerans]SES20487.1 arabinogalactan oligomer / maltooligosaccharide transport system permease protein [Salisedimin
MSQTTKKPMSRKKKNTLELIAMYSIIGVMFVIILYPLLWTLGLSLNPGRGLFGAEMIPTDWSLVHYEWLFFSENSDYLTWYRNSLIVAIATSAFATMIVCFTAYAFSRYRFKGRKNGLYAFLLLQMFPILMAMVALYILLNTVGLLDTLTGLILIYVGGAIPMNAFLVKGYFDSIPRELDESAKIDGAGHFRIFFQILLPLAKPILAVVALFNFMQPFMDFLLPRIVLRSPENYTLALGLFNFVNDEFSNNFTRFAAGSILIAVPIAAVYLFLQRYLISGLASGATKG